MSKKEKEKQGLCRRDFLKGLAAGTAGVASGSLLSGRGSVKSAGATEVSASLIPASWDMEADVVVLGYDGNPIPRLYETGALGSIWGDHYGPFGGNVGVSVLAGGRIAGRHASAEKPWE